ncbi:hypothetical protein OJ996_00900 [Luteolibacter sp. GHJ8]|uniref:Tetratricopeptide repeat protein n=1 Tax=Luteolibacter rhizosphaerae TaxID=2989719 RepID=A0ABT3FX01_9BACT|nr:hypothetical protein [Luteolibacter rhizosphaerae]MCW1912109.1 hypothetical protein [Luteolibacter rhizosphaerae]
MSRLLGLFLLFILPAQACLWDRDTLQEEAKGKLDTVRAITGWFDRYPSRYYEMRLERVTAELSSNPRSLNLYDDAGVACSRLGRHDEAIAWMAKKKVALDALPDGGPADDRYRYLSNLGTFHLIRWMTAGESQRSENIGDLEVSETLIAQALDLNPDAHFGREQYQLMLIQWLLRGADVSSGDPFRESFLNLDISLMSHGSPSTSKDPTLEDARQGITGLIQMGAAWESIDVFRALQICLHGQQASSVAHLAYMRQQELAESGASSLHPDEEVRQAVRPYTFPGTFYGGKQVERFYRDARTAAAKRDQAWTAYQDDRFAQGMHPDTHPGFWKDWQGPEMPKMPNLTLGHFTNRYPGSSFAIIVGALVSGPIAIYLFARRVRRARRRRFVSAAA